MEAFQTIWYCYFYLSIKSEYFFHHCLFKIFKIPQQTLTVQKMLRPHQAPVPHSRADQSSHHTQHTLTSVPAQHGCRQQQSGGRFDGCRHDGPRGVRSPKVEIQSCGQKERQERDKESTRLTEKERKKQGDRSQYEFSRICWNLTYLSISHAESWSCKWE